VVTVPAGLTSATFTVATSVVTASTPVTITAIAGTGSRTASLTVVRNPSPPPTPGTPRLVSPADRATVSQPIACDWRDVVTAAAPAGGAVVALTTSNAGVAGVPATVPVAAGATTATFAITTTAVTAATPMTIGGSFGGASRTATLTVNPPAPPAQSATLSVT